MFFKFLNVGVFQNIYTNTPDQTFVLYLTLKLYNRGSLNN